MKKILLLITAMLLPFSAFSGRLFRIYTSDMVGYNGLGLEAKFVQTDYLSDYTMNQYSLNIDYGVGTGASMFFEFPFLSLSGIDNSLIISDLKMGLSLNLFSNLNNAGTGFNAFHIHFGVDVATGVQEGEGKVHPATGETQQYYPFVNGLGEIFLGAGYSFSVNKFKIHLNSFYYLDCRGNESALEFKIINDHVELGGAIQYYKEFNFIGLNWGIKPFYEMILRLKWDGDAVIPTMVHNDFAFWLRLGSIFRFAFGINLPYSLEGRSFLDFEYFLKFSAVFR